MNADRWRPITRDELLRLIEEELKECPSDLARTFAQYSVDPYCASIRRFGADTDVVFVAARKGNEVMYFNDIECGWNFSPIDKDGTVLEHWCNQDALKDALWHWADYGRGEE